MAHDGAARDPRVPDRAKRVLLLTTQVPRSRWTTCEILQRHIAATALPTDPPCSVEDVGDDLALNWLGNGYVPRHRVTRSFWRRARRDDEIWRYEHDVKWLGQEGVQARPIGAEGEPWDGFVGYPRMQDRWWERS